MRETLRRPIRRSTTRYWDPVTRAAKMSETASGGDPVATPSPWPVIHAERRALAADLASLSEEQGATPPLAAGWTVREVLGHMTATAASTVPQFFARLVGSGFRF